MEDVAYQYASRVVSGEIIASKKVIKACKRHLRDLKRMDDEDFPYIYLPDKAKNPIDFIEMLPDVKMVML